MKRFALAAMAMLLPPADLRAEMRTVLVQTDVASRGDPFLLEATDQLREELAARGLVVLPLEPGAALPPPPSLAELDRAYLDAVAARAAGRFDDAAAALSAVVEGLEQQFQNAEAFPRWTRAMQRLARAEQERGRRVDTQGILERLLVAQPDLAIDPRQFPPSFLALVEEARERVRTLSTHLLTIRSSPDVPILLDGRPVGTTPLRLAVPSGRHWVAIAARPGALEAPAVAVDLNADRSIDFHLDAVWRDARLGVSFALDGGPLRFLPAYTPPSPDRIVTTSRLIREDGTSLVATLREVRGDPVDREGRLVLLGAKPRHGGMEPLADFLLAPHPPARGSVRRPDHYRPFAP